MSSSRRRDVGAPPFECGGGSEFVMRGKCAGDYEDCDDLLLKFEIQVQCCLFTLLIIYHFLF